MNEPKGSEGRFYIDKGDRYEPCMSKDEVYSVKESKLVFIYNHSGAIPEHIINKKDIDNGKAKG